MPIVSQFKNVYSKIPQQDLQIEEILAGIKNGKWRDQVVALRELRQNCGEEAYKEEKKKLPAFCISAIAENRTTLVEHSGFIQVDIDNLEGDLAEARKQIESDPFTALCFISAGNQGLKVGVRIDPSKHQESFKGLQSYYQTVFGLTIDPACSDVLRLCFVSDDRDLYMNLDAPVFECVDNDASSEDNPNNTTTKQMKKIPALTQARLFFPPPNGSRHNSVLKIAFALAANGFEKDEIYNIIRPKFDADTFPDEELNDIIVGALKKAPPLLKNTTDYEKRKFVIQCCFNQQEGDAALIESVVKGQILYNHTRKSWMRYKDGMWKEDKTGQARSEGIEILRDHYYGLSLLMREEIKKKSEAEYITE